MKETIAFIVVLFVAIFLGILGWKAERWVNWKLSYGSKVEQRIEKLEKRIEQLENRLDNSD